MLERELHQSLHRGQQKTWLPKNANHGRTLGPEQMSENTTVLPHRPMTPISDDEPKATYAFTFQKLAKTLHCRVRRIPLRILVHMSKPRSHATTCALPRTSFQFVQAGAELVLDLDVLLIRP